MALDIRTLALDDLDALADLRVQAFGGSPTPLRAETLVTPVEDAVAAYAGDRLVACASVLAMDQWFGGRAVPCGGVAGVVVAPDQRGRGLARTLLLEAQRRMRERGLVISALYPTTASLYRGLGWEVAGWWERRQVAVADLPAPTGAVAWEPVEHTDPLLATVHDAGARGRDGWIVPPARWWRAQGLRRAEDPAPAWTWLGRRQGEPVSAVGYRHGRAERWLFDVEADLVAGVDGPALTDALALLGRHGTTADRVSVTVPGRLLARHVAEASRTPVAYDWPWMLLLVDLPGALAARGWPAGVDLEVALEVGAPRVADAEAPSGRWVLRVAGGGATCEPGGPGTVGLDLGDLASLYAGGVDPAALAADGRLTGADERALSGLRAAFAGDPTLPWFF